MIFKGSSVDQAVSLSPRRLGFDSRFDHLRFVVDRVYTYYDRVFSEYVGFPLSIEFHPFSIVIFNCMLQLTLGQRAKPGPSKCNALSEIWERWIEKYFYLFFTLSSSTCEMVRKIASCYCMFLMQPSRFQFSEINLA